MSKTTTEHTTFFGLFNDGFKASDDNGHTGFGESAEAANEALQHAQEEDVEFSAYTALRGWLEW
jgi:hypothetical protein